MNEGALIQFGLNTRAKTPAQIKSAGVSTSWLTMEINNDAASVLGHMDSLHVCCV